MRQGHADVAEREYQRALQLDPSNAQATSLLAQIQKDRQAREREQHLNQALREVEYLLSGNRRVEAERMLTELQQAYPHSDEVQQKLEALKPKTAPPTAEPN